MKVWITPGSDVTQSEVSMDTKLGVAAEWLPKQQQQ